MDIIRVKTEKGLELPGVIYGTPSNSTVLIMLTGICSNVFQNELLHSTGKLLSKHNISTIIAHTHDSFSCFAYKDNSIGKQRHTGVFNDDFSMVYEEVESYVKYAKEAGFKKIILAGHSLGSNKIIHYLGTTKDDIVDYFIITSPIDIMHWWNIMPNIEQCYKLAKEFINKGQGNNILPVLFGGFSPMTANSVLGFYNAENLKNCPVISQKGETQSIFNIKPNGSFIIGSKDSVTGRNPKSFIEKLCAWTKNPSKNLVIEIENATHIFFGMHEIYAQTILECINNHYLKTAKETI